MIANYKVQLNLVINGGSKVHPYVKCQNISLARVSCLFKQLNPPPLTSWPQKVLIKPCCRCRPPLSTQQERWWRSINGWCDSSCCCYTLLKTVSQCWHQNYDEYPILRCQGRYLQVSFYWDRYPLILYKFCIVLKPPCGQVSQFEVKTTFNTQLQSRYIFLKCKMC